MPSFIVQTDLGFDIPNTNANDGCYKTWICNLIYPIVLHDDFDNVATVRIPVSVG